MLGRAVLLGVGLSGLSADAPQTGAIARFEPMVWITDGDYPKEALRARVQGGVVFLLDLDERGRVAACSIVRSSGADILDRATCDLLRRRAVFKVPSTGEPGPSFRVGYYEWKLPAD